MKVTSHHIPKSVLLTLKDSVLGKAYIMEQESWGPSQNSAYPNVPFKCRIDQGDSGINGASRAVVTEFSLLFPNPLCAKQ